MPDRQGARRPAAALLLAFDVGTRRIGIAHGDTVSGAAAPEGHLPATDGVPRWEDVDDLLERWRPDRLIVGLPYNVDGSESPQTRVARAFAATLATRYRVPVTLVDERYSSLEAGERLRESRRQGLKRRRVSRGDVDAAAACIILERWLANPHQFC